MFLDKVRPSSILDVGVGNGKMGFIARDLLDVMLGERHRKEDWRIRIDGIEVFPDYIQGHQRAIYDNIYIGDAFEVIDRLGKYDLIIIGDVLEHFEKEKAWEFADKCAAHCNNFMIFNIPLGERWTQGEIYGNPHERHLSFWSYEEFEPFVEEKDLFSFPGIGLYGCLLINKNDYIHHRLRYKAECMAANGKTKDAVSFLEAGLSELPLYIESEYMLVDLLLKEGRIVEAIERLRRVRDVFPEEQSARTYLERLCQLLGINNG